MKGHVNGRFFSDSNKVLSLLAHTLRFFSMSVDLTLWKGESSCFNQGVIGLRKGRGHFWTINVYVDLLVIS